MSESYDQHIAKLLKNHDCVIIPEFGGFVGNYSAAKINPINHRFEPPYRKITFNKLLTHNDGLLVSLIAQTHDLSFEEAKQKLTGYSVLLSKKFKDEKKLRFDKIGVLSQNQDGTFRFEQFKDEAFFADGFGLESFFGKKIERKRSTTVAIEPEAQRKKAVVTPPKKEKKEASIIPINAESNTDVNAVDEKKEDSKKRSVFWPAAAAAILIPFFSFLLWFLIGTDTPQNPKDFHTSDLNPFTEEVCPTYSLREGQILDENFENESLIIDWEEARANTKLVKVYSRQGKDKTLVVSLEEKVELIAKAEPNLRFHIIGGCFSDIRYADAMVNKFQKRGSMAAIIDKKGTLNRVSIARFATKKEAKQELASFRNDIPNAWILYK